MRSDSFHRQTVQRSAVLSCKRDLKASFFPPGDRKSTVTGAQAPAVEKIAFSATKCCYQTDLTPTSDVLCSRSRNSDLMAGNWEHS
jgi:hypothetical protein